MRITHSLVLWLASASPLLTSIAIAAEPWADPRLEPPEGLELWLDASRVHNAAPEAGLQAVNDGDAVARWADASGAWRHPVQTDAQQRPLWVRLGSKDEQANESDLGAFRFDGIDDCLQVPDFGRRYDSFTAYVVAVPRSNAGGFRGLLAGYQTGRRDYETGFNIDLSYQLTLAFDNVNVEGRGFRGALDLLNATSPFGTLHVLETKASAQDRTVQFISDEGKPSSRPYEPGELILDELVIGARHFQDGAGGVSVNGFFDGEIAEVLLFSRALNDDEAAVVRNYLLNKYESAAETLVRERQLAAAAANIEPLTPVENPPPVQMLIPGFSVRELPVELTNINNLRYRPDGALYALGYNGDVWLLRDTDDDGLEDAPQKFFDSQGRLRGPIGMQVIPEGHPLLTGKYHDGAPAVRGVVVASKGKISAILDRDGDDVAETEQVIATGWKETFHSVDTIGLAIHPDDGAIYFGLGTAAFNNAYLLDKDGKAAFDLAGDHGTIQRLEPDLSGRSTVCTGVRFTVGLEFNDAGDLFASDQEGATWLPNGNPFDELLLIEPGKHYGFPPRHPRHLPEVLDEPSLFDYMPQHQSTCGIAFNRPCEVDGPVFGPDDWRGDLFVCGESRGKLYRTELTRDSEGRYVARNHLIGCLAMLTVDCCVTPRGDLLIACHSGGPDWGTGPGGIGKLYSVRYEHRDPPQPISVQAAGPQEVHVQFDRPLDPSHVADLNAETRITYGPYVAAGDRFESIRPGYAVTQMQMTSPRYRLPIYNVSLTPDRRLLILSTERHPAAVNYALRLPGLGRTTSDAEDGLPQHDEIDLAYDLCGVVAHWTPQGDGSSAWTRNWTHLDPTVARAFGVGEQTRSEFDPLAQPGTLTLSTQIDSRGLLYPTVQPGSKLDYERSADEWIQQSELVVRCSAAFNIEQSGKSKTSSAMEDGSHELALPLDHEKPLPLTLRVATGSKPLKLSVSWRATLKDGAVRTGALPLRRFLLPWADLDETSESKQPDRDVPELAGGNWGRGRRVFFSAEAGCSKCHVAHGSGGRIGADLSNLIHRDYGSVLRDVTQPSFAINPDFITYSAVLRDGRVLTGVVASDGEDLLIGSQEGVVTRVPRAEVEVLQASTVSTMPEGIPKKLGPDKMRDLLMFLLKEPPRMPLESPLPAPAPRTRAEVAAVLAQSRPPTDTLRHLNILLVAGAKDHGPGEHDYPAWLQVWSELLAAAEGVTVATAMEWPAQEQIDAADTIVFYQRGSWTPERAKAIDAFLARGGGLVYIHWAVEAGPNAPDFAQRIGLASNGGALKFRHGPLDLGFETGRDHPIARNFERVHFHDESYWRLQGDVSRVQVLATGVEEGEPRPLFWCLEPRGGRVFVSIPGHFSWTFHDPLFRILLLRGLAWSANEPVDRFNELATLGVTLSDGGSD